MPRSIFRAWQWVALPGIVDALLFAADMKAI